jgi:hypothetical protein
VVRPSGYCEDTESRSDGVNRNRNRGGARYDKNPPEQNRRRTHPMPFTLGRGLHERANRDGKKAREESVTADKMEDGRIHGASPCLHTCGGVIRLRIDKLSVSWQSKFAKRDTEQVDARRQDDNNPRPHFVLDDLALRDFSQFNRRRFRSDNALSYSAITFRWY